MDTVSWGPALILVGNRMLVVHNVALAFPWSGNSAEFAAPIRGVPFLEALAECTEIEAGFRSIVVACISE